MLSSLSMPYMVLVRLADVCVSAYSAAGQLRPDWDQEDEPKSTSSEEVLAPVSTTPRVMTPPTVPE